jgi:hypothetical protein
MRLWSGALAFATMIACGRSPSSEPPSRSAVRTATCRSSAVTGTPDSGALPDGIGDGALRLACDGPPPVYLPMNNVEDLRSTVPGRWVRCARAAEPPSMGIRLPSHAGIEIGPDGSFALLDWADDRTLVPSIASERTGLVEYIDYSAVSGNPWWFTAAFHQRSGPTSEWFPWFGDSPRMMRINGSGERYVSEASIDRTRTLPAAGGTAVPELTRDAVGPACQRTSGAKRSLSSILEARAALSRKWITCERNGFDWVHGAGFEVDGDDHFWSLEWDDHGRLRRGSADPAGILDYSFAFRGQPMAGTDPISQVDLSFATSMVPLHMELSRSPAVLVEVDTGGSGRFIPADVEDDCAPDAPELAVLPFANRDAAEAACRRDDGRTIPIGTVSEGRDALTRVWVLCSALGLFRKLQAGVEVRSTGEFALLAWDQTGRLRRLAGMENEGTWTMIDTSAMNGRPTFQVNYSMSGTIYSFLSVTDNGMLIIDNNGVDRYRYVDLASAAP